MNAASATPHAFVPSPLVPARRILQRAFEALTWRHLGTVLLLCVILSTEFLAQPTLYARWSVEQILEGWGYYFAEITAVGFAMLACFALVDAAVSRDGLHRFAAVAIALPIGAAVAYGIALVLIYAAGFFPSPVQFAGEALRFAAMGCAIAFIYLLRRRVEATARTMHETEVARHDLAKQTAEAKLQLLEAQIEPHFLFNSLANVQRLFETDPESGERLLQNLKAYLRAALPQMRESRSTLAGEADLSRAYLEILGARMGKRLRFAIDVPAALRDHAFPSMMLITLVENAVKHGIHPSPDGGEVALRVRRDHARLVVDVIDTGVGFRGDGGNGVGLTNIRARLTALYGAAGKLSLEGNEPHGVIASIAVPFPESGGPK